MPKWLKTTQSVSSRVVVIQQSQSSSSQFRQGAGEVATLKPSLAEDYALPRATLGELGCTHTTWGNPEAGEKKANSMSPF